MNFSPLKTLFFIAFLAVSLAASTFPKSFAATGDALYETIEKYEKIITLKMYESRPELLEAFCVEANATMQKGFKLDAMQEDPEAKIDKVAIKAYVKELRRLSMQNDLILNTLQKDVQGLLQKKDLKALEIFSDAKIPSSTQALKSLQSEIMESKRAASAVEEFVEEAPDLLTKEEKMHKELAFYKNNLESLKEKLYATRERGEEQSACLNDITAINYWIIKAFENEQEACELMKAIKQMKSYDKALSSSCGEDSMHYVEWHGRIKPYVGKRLFEAEANCR